MAMASRNKVASWDDRVEVDHHPRVPPAGDDKPSRDEKPSGDDKHSGGEKLSSDSTEYQLRKYLLLLATLVATVTYVAGLNLPGGAWQDTKDGHVAGDPILRDAHYHRYLMFYYCNATAFAASLVVSLLLLVLNGKNTGWEALLRVVMVLDLLALMGAYAAGSCRDLFTTIYSAVLVCAVFAYIMLAFFAFSFHYWGWTKLSKKHGGDPEKQDGKDTERHEREELHEVLMLLATFAVTLTYGAGLDPPGGFWADTQGGHHHVSDPILREHYPSRYHAFFVCNTTAFVASLLIIILLLDKRLSKKSSVRFVALHGFIITALLGLMGAYAAGSCREVQDTTYVVCLIGAVLAYIFLQVALNNVLKGLVCKPKGRFCSIQGPKKFCSYALERMERIRNFFDTFQSEDKEIQASSKKRKNEELERARSLVLLLATLVVSITYQAGLAPPGGLWSKDGDGYQNGDPILLTTHPTRYKVFFYSNSAAFVASLIIIIMVQSKFLLERHTLEAAMILELFGLIGSYAAGSCRDEKTSIYVVALAGGVLAYVVIHIVFFTLDHKDKPSDADKMEHRREVLLLLAILAATLTYQAGLTPPGGFWSANDPDGHRAGFPILLDNYPRRYNIFFYCNAASFMSSIAVIVLLVNPNLYRPGIRCYALYVCMVVGMFGLMGAYAAGSSRHLRTSIYVLTLVVAVLAFVALEVVVFWIYPYVKTQSNSNKDGSSVQGSNTGQQNIGSPNQGSKIKECAPTGDNKLGNNGNKSGSSGQDSNVTIQNTGSLNQGSELQESDPTEDKNKSEYFLLLGVLAASVTYQTGLKPPGGLWEDNNNGHSAGNPILHNINAGRYHAFFYSNSTSFMASIVIIILLLLQTLHKKKYELPPWPMQTAILLDMLGLLGAYAAGSARDWETSRNVIYLVIPVLAYIAAYAVVLFFRKKSGGEHQTSAGTE